MVCHTVNWPSRCERRLNGRVAAWTQRLQRGELGQGVNDSGEKRVAAAVAGVVEDLQPAGRPPPAQPPGGLQRTADVVAAVDEHPGDTVQSGRLSQQLVVLQEGGVAPVVRDKPRKPEAELRVVVARVRPMAGREGDVRLFPGAPFPRRVLPDRGV